MPSFSMRRIDVRTRHALQDAELAELGGTLRVVVVLGEEDLLVEAADGVVRLLAGEHAEARRVG